MIRLLALAGTLAAGVASAAPLPKVGTDLQLLALFEDGSIKILDPDGKLPARELAAGHGDGTPVDARLSPDGQRIAYLVKPKADSHDVEFRIRPLEGKGDAVRLHAVQHAAHWFFGPDGKTLYGSGLDFEAAKNPNKFRHECWINWAIDSGKPEAKAIDLGGEYRIFAIDRAGERFATIRTFDLRPVAPGVSTPRIETHWTDRKTLKHELAIPAAADLMPQSAFPDNDRWFVRRDPAKRTLDRMAIYSTKGAAAESMVDSPEGPVRHLALAPDGKRLAYTTTADAETRIVVAGANGKEPRTILNSPVGIAALSWK
jgi:hypothetical protein